ncbi:taste receptor type 2 member 1-like [Fukomys damarensis]|uniref:taste receptor type 2 member 1-like n=1 Tax=Fukomys damarensis TaxID=885580 RepID=UPI00053F8876|nr:taste receptor type 2 member 1-like [Fukomys damarensis]
MALSFLSVVHMTIMLATFFAGITVNGFLLIVNCKDFIKIRKVSPMQILLICIALSRLGLQIMLMAHSVVSVFFSCNYLEFISNVKITFIWMLFNSTSFWFTTCLSVFYCLKISVFTQSYFLWLKFRISTLIYWLLLGSVLASLSTAALCIGLRVPIDVFGNDTQGRTTVDTLDTYAYLLPNLTLIFPLVIFVICTSLLFVSLYKHTHRMQNGLHGSSNPKKEAHINALKTVVSFFCFFVSYFAAFMANMTFRVPYRSAQFFVMKEIMAAFPAGHSVIIILSNSKFQRSFRRIVCLKKKQ